LGIYVRYQDELSEWLNKIVESGEVLGLIDTDVSSFTYISILQALGRLLDGGRYLWIVSYEPLQSLLRDFKRAGISYEEHLGKDIYVLDVFGSIRNIDPQMNGVFILRGYLDDRVFVLKYRKLIEELVSKLHIPLDNVIVVGYLESGMCRLFDNPSRTQRLLWNLRNEMGHKTPGIITYIKPECPELEEFIYMYADVVFEGFLDQQQRRLLMTKGVKNEIGHRN
jgi:hypothetical protein